MKMIRTTLADKPEQFVTGNDEKHVGRRVLVEKLNIYRVFARWNGSTYVEYEAVLFQLDFDAGLVFVDPDQLRPYPSEPIEEPGK